MPTSYSWNLVSVPLSGSPPDPGPFVPRPPSGQDIKRKQFERGIKFANVPGGRADNVVHGGPRVQHVNSVQNVFQGTSDVLVPDGNYSGVVKFRFRDYRRFPMPDSVNRIEFRSSDRFTNPVFPFTGQYPPGHVFFSLGQGSVSFEGSMGSPRSRYVVGKLLGPQNLAIVAGGWISNGVTGSALNSAETYFSGTGLWTTIAPMPFFKSQAAAVVLRDSGDFVVFGGTTGSFYDAEEGVRACRYIAASGTWVTIAASASVPRRDFEVVQLQDGRVFLPDGALSELFLTASETYQSGPGWPLPPVTRESYTTTLLDDGTVLVCGGRDPIDLEPSRHAFRFYPTLMSWSIEPSMSIGRAGHQTVSIDGNVLVMGGFTPDSTASFPFGFPGPLGGTGDDFNSISNVEIYNPNERTWMPAPPMPVPRTRFSALGHNRDGGRVIVLGGYDATTPVSGVDVYIFSENDWRTVTPLLSGVYDIHAVQLNPNISEFDFKILIPGGQLSGSTFSGSQLYRTSG